MKRAIVAAILLSATTTGCRQPIACATFEDSASQGERCTASWARCEDTQARAVVCTDGGRCACQVDGYPRRAFTHARFCALEGEESVTEVANRECGWRLRVGEPGLALPF